jgi:hypothetical protein
MMEELLEAVKKLKEFWLNLNENPPECQISDAQCARVFGTTGK